MTAVKRCLVPGCELRRAREGLCTVHLAEEASVDPATDVDVAAVVSIHVPLPGSCLRCGVRIEWFGFRWVDPTSKKPHICEGV